MSKLRKAVSKLRLQRLGQDIEPPKAATAVPVVAPAGDEGEPKPLRARMRRRAARAGSHEPANENGAPAAPQGENEPKSIQAARQRLRAMIAAVSKGAPKPSIGIVLAIVNQETGNNAAANTLIDEYELERRFGIKKLPND